MKKITLPKLMRWIAFLSSSSAPAWAMTQVTNRWCWTGRSSNSSVSGWHCCTGSWHLRWESCFWLSPEFWNFWTVNLAVSVLPEPSHRRLRSFSFKCFSEPAFYTISPVPSRNLVVTDNSHFRPPVLHFKHLKTERELTMTHNARTYAYRYFSFTYEFGKAYFGLA